jgi:hypothetical protein
MPQKKVPINSVKKIESPTIGFGLVLIFLLKDGK